MADRVQGSHHDDATQRPVVCHRRWGSARGRIGSAIARRAWIVKCRAGRRRRISPRHDIRRRDRGTIQVQNAPCSIPRRNLIGERRLVGRELGAVDVADGRRHQRQRGTPVVGGTPQYGDLSRGAHGVPPCLIEAHDALGQHRDLASHVVLCRIRSSTCTEMDQTGIPTSERNTEATHEAGHLRGARKQPIGQNVFGRAISIERERGGFTQRGTDGAGTAAGRPVGTQGACRATCDEMARKVREAAGRGVRSNGGCPQGCTGIDERRGDAASEAVLQACAIDGRVDERPRGPMDQVATQYLEAAGAIDRLDLIQRRRHPVHIHRDRVAEPVDDARCEHGRGDGLDAFAAAQFLEHLAEVAIVVRQAHRSPACQGIDAHLDRTTDTRRGRSAHARSCRRTASRRARLGCYRRRYCCGHHTHHQRRHRPHTALVIGPPVVRLLHPLPLASLSKPSSKR
ncbi:hypothetical protein APY03_6466 [Variovorax sp. WDL1]|nr:hypothetical protein APY03_6466 [Variovorax sp. WDL1]